MLHKDTNRSCSIVSGAKAVDLRLPNDKLLSIKIRLEDSALQVSQEGEEKDLE